MESKTERHDARKPYEPPAIRELGKVAEVTFGINSIPNQTDNAIISLAI